MAITIYRVTVHGDGIGGADKIVFNSSKNTRVPNAFIPDYEIMDSSALGENQAPTQDTGNMQHLGKIEDLYIFKGFISKRDTDVTYITKLKQWDDEPKVNTVFTQGRFGVAFDDFSQYNRVPVDTGNSQLGLLWLYLKWRNDFRRHPLHANFELAFKVSRSDGT